MCTYSHAYSSHTSLQGLAKGHCNYIYACNTICTTAFQFVIISWLKCRDHTRTGRYHSILAFSVCSQMLCTWRLWMWLKTIERIQCETYPFYNISFTFVFNSSIEQSYLLVCVLQGLNEKIRWNAFHL